MTKRYSILVDYYQAIIKPLKTLTLLFGGPPVGGALGVITSTVAICLFYGKPPHPAAYGLLFGNVIVGAIIFIVFRLSKIEDEESKVTMVQILMLNFFIGFTATYFYIQNNMGVINVFGHHFSGLPGSYDSLEILRASRRMDFASIAMSNFAVSVVGAFLLSFCVYGLNLFLVKHYKIVGAQSFPRVLAIILLIICIGSAACGGYSFFDRYSH